MSNLFFKSESVKNSVKSGLNLVSKQVFKAFLLMSMMLLSWNGWAQGYEVFYPNNQTVAIPGDTVTVVFDQDVSNFVYGTSSTESCNEETSAYFNILGWDWKGDVDSKGEIISPEDCAGDYDGYGESIFVKDGQEGVKTAIRVVIPEGYVDPVYQLHFGEKKENKAEYIWGLLKIWTKSFDYKGFVSIDIETDKLALRTNPGCICPNDVVRVTLENNKYSSLVWTYFIDEKTEKTLLNVSMVDEDVYEIQIPSDISGDITIKCRGREPGSESSTAELMLCKPSFSGVPNCAKAKSDIAFQIDGACPNLTYTLEGPNLKTPLSFSGSNYYPVSFNIGTYPSGENVKTYLLKLGDEVITSFNVGRCDIELLCPTDKIPTEVPVPEDDCSISIFDVAGYFPITNNNQK